MIRRRRLVALVSAIALLVIGFVIIVTGLFVTRTSYGQEELRRLIQGQLASAIKGRVYLGPMSGGFLTGTLKEIVGAGASGRLIGHVVWQGRPAQPNFHQSLPMTMTLRMDGSLGISFCPRRAWRR